jgi:hypothetical protein
MGAVDSKVESSTDAVHRGDTKQIRTFYKFHDVWQTLFEPIMSDPKVVAVRNVILEDIRSKMSDRVYVDEFIPDTPFRTKFLSAFSDIKTHDEQRAYIDTFVWGKFSPVSEPEDKETYDLVASDEYDVSKQVQHYMYLHFCQFLSLLIWTWCKTLWPSKTWLIVDTGDHTFVMDADDPCTVYDVLWQYIGVDVATIDLSRFCCYTDPVNFYVKRVLGLTPWASREQMTAYLDKERSDAISRGGRSAKGADVRYNNRMTFEVPQALLLQEAFAWITDRQVCSSIIT